MNTLRAIDIRQTCKINGITKFIKTRGIEWTDHVTRAEDNRLIKLARAGLDWTLNKERMK